MTMVDEQVVRLRFFYSLLVMGLSMGCETGADGDRDIRPPDASVTDGETDAMVMGIHDVEAEVSDTISTVVSVEWQTDEPTRGYVEYGLTEKLGETTPKTQKKSKKSRTTLLGLKPNTRYHYRVVAETG